jgi:hypothetical protein
MHVLLVERGELREKEDDVGYKGERDGKERAK